MLETNSGLTDATESGQSKATSAIVHDGRSK